MSAATPIGIETVYRGYRFRSRAEARWAAYFDLLKWKWQYEPLDLMGYIPDFVLEFREPLLIEVKGGVLPADAFGSEQIAMACSKIEVSGWKHRAVVVGAAPNFGGRWHVGPCVGTLCNEPFDDAGWSSAALFRCLACARPSICSDENSWACLACGAYDGNAYVGALEEAEELWAEACNLTRWK